MNLGQILLIVLALSLLATLQLTINSSILRASLITMDNEAKIDAISIAQAMVDEINSRAFDSITVDSILFFTSGLTREIDFGPDMPIETNVTPFEREPFKSQTLFNDVDDYHGYTRMVQSSHLGTFLVRDSIIYVTSSDQDRYSPVPTWYKKIIVVVKHPNMVDSVMIKSLSVYREYL